LAVFILIEYRRSDPAIPIRIFSNPLVSGAQRTVSESFGYAYRWAMMTCAVLALGGGLVSALTITGQKGQV